MNSSHSAHPYLILCTALAGLTTLQPGPAVAASADSTEVSATAILYKTVRDMAYYSEAKADGYMKQQCRLDLYYPENRSGFATVVWFHAGGLKQGKRYVPGELMNQGFAVAAVDYRLNPNVTAPAYIEDAAAATAWIFNNIEQYGGSADRIVIAGASAGGYLSTMVGLDKSWLAVHGIDADRLAGIVSLSGQAITHVAVREEQGIERTRPVIDRLAPLYHVRKDAPPLLIVTGDRELELLGRYEENAFFARMMKVAGHQRTTLHELKGRDHPGVEKPGHAFLLRFMDSLEMAE